MGAALGTLAPGPTQDVETDLGSELPLVSFPHSSHLLKHFLSLITVERPRREQARSRAGGQLGVSVVATAHTPEEPDWRRAEKGTGAGSAGPRGPPSAPPQPASYGARPRGRARSSERWQDVPGASRWRGRGRE